MITRKLSPTTLRLLVTLFVAGAMLSACGSDGGDDDDNTPSAYANPTQADCDRTGVSAEMCGLRLTEETTTCDFAPFRYSVHRQGWTKHIDCSADAGYLPGDPEADAEHYSRKVTSAQAESVTLNMIDDASEWAKAQCDMQLNLATRQTATQKTEDHITAKAWMYMATATVAMFQSNNPLTAPAFGFANCTYSSE